MNLEHYRKFFESRFKLQTGKEETTSNGAEVLEGSLTSNNGQVRRFPIINGIPRFLDEADNYSGNFGLQWNKFRTTQNDSVTGLSLSEKRFWENTRWTMEELKGKLVLEAGSGAGRFTEVLAKTGATVISFDLSNAVEANYRNNHGKGDILIFQGNIYDIPFPDNYFDYVFCYGVLQHTPDPDRSYRALFSKLKPGGKISIDYYLKFDHPTPWSTPKYFWRPITKKMSPKLLLRIIRIYMPVWLPIDTLIRRIPRVGNRILAFLRIPCWNYLDQGFTYSQRLQWAILDTFDALAPAYDFPKTKIEVEQMVQSDSNASVEVFYGSNGVVANVTKK